MLCDHNRCCSFEYLCKKVRNHGQMVKGGRILLMNLTKVIQYCYLMQQFVFCQLSTSLEFYIIFRKIAYEKEVYNEDLWKISWNEVQQNQIVSQIVSNLLDVVDVFLPSAKEVEGR